MQDQRLKSTVCLYNCSYLYYTQVASFLLCCLMLSLASATVAATNETAQGRNELLNEEITQILFIERAVWQSTHYYSDFIDGAKILGTRLCVLDLKSGQVRSLVPQLQGGLIGHCDLSFDGKKVVFDYKAKIGEGFRIWTVNIDGTQPKQITFPSTDEEVRIKKYSHRKRLEYYMAQTNGAKRLPVTVEADRFYSHHTDDMQPCWLPDGSIAFVSTRCEYSILCDDFDTLTTSLLYRMQADGSNMEKLSNNALSEAVPSVSEDGRILYTRWEYVDNGAVSNKGVWIVRPDGTGAEELYGANIEFPAVHYAPRVVPGTNGRRFVCIGAPHMPAPLGAVILVDTSRNRRTGDPMTYITPEVETRHQMFWDNFPDEKVKPIQAPYTDNPPFHTSQKSDGAGNTKSGPLYADPYPISEELFLVSYNPTSFWNTPNAYSLYLIDANGKRLPVYSNPETSCWNALPVQERPTAPIVRGITDPKLAKQNKAQLIVTNVYHGMDGVKPGTIKYLRVNEHVPRPWSAHRFWAKPDRPGEAPTNYDLYDQQHSVISKNTHLGLKLQLGIVPVETDGSANFLVDADKNIFLQALDSEYREVQRERTFVNYRPGEIRSCIGCHEQAGDTNPNRNKAVTPLALRRAPSLPGPQPGERSGAKPLHYPTDVQPVLDKYCVKCHGDTSPAGGVVLTGEKTDLFSKSYETLIDRRTFPIIGENHPKMGNNHYLPPYTLGSHASSLITRVLDDSKSPCYTTMPIEDRVRLTTWIDGNGQFYGTYYGPKSLRYEKFPGFRHEPTFEEVRRNNN